MMPTQLDSLFALHAQAFSLRNQRAQVLASNIANADTPGYRARDIDFRAALEAAQNGQPQAGATAMARTAGRHLAGVAEGGPAGASVLYRTVTQAAADNNTVDVNVERAQFADNAMRQEASLIFLNGKIKAMLAAMQG